MKTISLSIGIVNHCIVEKTFPYWRIENIVDCLHRLCKALIPCISDPLILLYVQIFFESIKQYSLIESLKFLTQLGITHIQVEIVICFKLKAKLLSSREVPKSASCVYDDISVFKTGTLSKISEEKKLRTENHYFDLYSFFLSKMSLRDRLVFNLLFQ